MKVKIGKFISLRKVVQLILLSTCTIYRTVFFLESKYRISAPCASTVRFPHNTHGQVRINIVIELHSSLYRRVLGN